MAQLVNIILWVLNDTETNFNIRSGFVTNKARLSFLEQDRTFNINLNFFIWILFYDSINCFPRHSPWLSELIGRDPTLICTNDFRFGVANFPKMSDLPFVYLLVFD